MTRSRGMSHMSAIFNFDFQHKSLVYLKCFILIQTLSQSDIWLWRYKHFLKFKNNKKQEFVTSLSLNSKSIFSTSDSFPWSCHICFSRSLQLITQIPLTGNLALLDGCSFDMLPSLIWSISYLQHNSKYVAQFPSWAGIPPGIPAGIT